MRVMNSLPVQLAGVAVALALVLIPALDRSAAQTVAKAKPPTKVVTSDAEIAGALLAAACMNIPSGELALKRSSTPEVRSFAQDLIAESTQVVKAARLAVKELKIEPVTSKATAGLSETVREMLQELAATDGGGFDTHYLRGESDYLQAVLQTLDQVLIPEAQDAELKRLLVDFRATVEDHLEQADAISPDRAGGVSSTRSH